MSAEIRVAEVDYFRKMRDTKVFTYGKQNMGPTT